MPYSDPLADGPVIQAAAARSLARGTNFENIIDMLKEVVPQLSCPVALFTYYNPILKRGVENFMTILNDTGVHGPANYAHYSNRMNEFHCRSIRRICLPCIKQAGSSWFWNIKTRASETGGWLGCGQPDCWKCNGENYGRSEVT